MCFYFIFFQVIQYSYLAFLRLFCHGTQDGLSNCTDLPLAPAAILVQYLLALVYLSSHNTLLKQWKKPQTFSSKPAQELCLFFWSTSLLEHSQLEFQGQPSVLGNCNCYSGTQHTEHFLVLSLWHRELAGADKCVLHTRLTKRSIVSTAEFSSLHWDSSPCCAYNGIEFSSHTNRNIGFCVERCGGETKQNTVIGENWSNTLMDIRWWDYLALLQSFITSHSVFAFTILISNTSQAYFFHALKWFEMHW